MYSVDAYDTPAAERTLNFVNTHLTHYIDLYTNCPTASYDMTHPYSSHQKSLFADLSPPLVEHDSYLLPQFAVDCIFEPSPEVSTGCLAFDAEPDASYFNHASNQLLSPAQSSSPPFAIEHTGRHDSLQHAPPEQQVHKKSSVSPSRRSNKRAKLSKPPASTLRSQRHKIKFTAEDDALLVDLKETYNYTWKQIEAYFPGRTHGTLQVRYCTRLKTQSSMWDDESVSYFKSHSFQLLFERKCSQGGNVITKSVVLISFSNQED
jgi:hypothetical protein